MMRFLPLLAFALLAVMLAVPLVLSKTPATQSRFGVTQAVPMFTLPLLEGKGMFSPELWQGRAALLNVFASWCTPCTIENPVLQTLSARVPVYGIAWHDKPAKVQRWLARHGSPFRIVGMDETGKLTVSLGLTGVPETLLIAPDGSIAWRYAGPVTDDIAREQILPLLETIQ